MGRPAKTLTDSQKAEVETLAAVLTAAQIADYFSIGRRTFFSMMERDPEIAAHYKKGKARAIGAIAQGLIQKARSGDTASMIFYLKTQAGWRETAAVDHRLTRAEPEAPGGAREVIVERLNRIAARQREIGLLEANAQPARALGWREATPIPGPGTTTNSGEADR